MKRIFVVLMCILCLFTFCSCNGLHTTVSQFRPNGREIIKIDAYPLGESVFFKSNTYISNISVNIMEYYHDKDEYSVFKKVYENVCLNTSQALEIVCDLKSEIPYIMIEFEHNGKVYNQYVYKNNKDGKLLLLER